MFGGFVKAFMVFTIIAIISMWVLFGYVGCKAVTHISENGVDQTMEDAGESIGRFMKGIDKGQE